MVLMADAGARTEEGVWGLGWLVLERLSREVVAAGQRWGTLEEGERPSITKLELEALAGAMRSLAILRAGRARELRTAQEATFSEKERRGLKALTRDLSEPKAE